MRVETLQSVVRTYLEVVAVIYMITSVVRTYLDAVAVIISALQLLSLQAFNSSMRNTASNIPDSKQYAFVTY